MEMELGDVLNSNLIQIGMYAKNKDEAIRKMAVNLKDNGYVDNADLFVEDIYLRESEGVTGIGNGIAIPHGKSTSAKHIGIAIATLKEPIEWETLDGKGVEAIFLFCVSADNEFEKNHLKLLSKLAGKLADDELLDKVKKVHTPEEMIGLLAGK